MWTHPDGALIANTLLDQAADVAAKAVQTRARWGVDHETEARARYRRVRPKEYVSGEQVLYLGRRFMLKVLDDLTPVVLRDFAATVLRFQLEIQIETTLRALSQRGIRHVLVITSPVK